MPTALIRALRKERQVDSCDFEARLVYVVSSKTAGLHRVTLPQKTKTIVIIIIVIIKQNFEEHEIDYVCVVLV